MNSAYQLNKKLSLHKETDCVDIATDIDSLLSLAGDAIHEYDSLEREKDDLEDEITKLEGDVEDFEDVIEGMEETGECKKWGLLGDQIKEAFEECMKSSKVNQIKFLDLLENTVKYGVMEQYC